MDATILLLPGDGIGPEVIEQAVRVLETVAAEFGHRFTFVRRLIGGAAIDATGAPLPVETLEACASADAVLLGAVGGPRWDGGPVRPEQGLLALRRELGTYANLRPLKVADSLADASCLREDLVRGTDLVFVRELTGGIYFGPKRRRGLAGGGFEALDSCRYTTAEIERVARKAGQLARGRRNRVTSVDKANVLETSRLWRETVTRLFQAEFPDVDLEHLLVDAAAMHLLRAPRRFDVVLTENLFGDILTDEMAAVAGSIGILPSASFGDAGAPGLFEPIHGSAPDLAGRGVANPYGAILSAALLLRYGLNLSAEAEVVERTAESLWAEGWRTPDMIDIGPAFGTEEIGIELCRRITARRTSPAAVA
jgi:3-isopropylmalate dehydrogenase